MRDPRSPGLGRMKPKFDPQARRDDAEALAIEALGFIAANPEELGRFLSLTGLGPQTLRQAARDPAFLASVLDYVGGNEAFLLAFAIHARRQPDAIAAARQILAGG